MIFLGYYDSRSSHINCDCEKNHDYRIVHYLMDIFNGISHV